MTYGGSVVVPHVVEDCRPTRIAGLVLALLLRSSPKKIIRKTKQENIHAFL